MKIRPALASTRPQTLALALLLALAACGRSEGPTEEAVADSVEIPADTAMQDVPMPVEDTEPAPAPPPPPERIEEDAQQAAEDAQAAVEDIEALEADLSDADAAGR